jgi:hypothetical protein
MKIDVCQFSCWCYSCENKIGKGEHMLEIYKKAQRGTARVNICGRCIKEFAKQITKKDVQAIENRIALKELEKESRIPHKCEDCDTGFCNFGEYPNCKTK